ncbi:GNAT family N-acetyltransferase [Methylobacterium sp.]|uniref:GNAT family N-acetyltransferase n=1 Tax=Methylobacterium sp. TaxID=409 RepID=UPI0025D937D1|nr:GNAT family N-acetyltransferase [Methylobacterium sp.]
MIVRDAERADMAGVQAIYAGYVTGSLASFEETVPSLPEMRSRFEAIRAGGFPYLVAEGEAGLLGYAYAGPYRTRSAYRHTLESSVYVAEGRRGGGIGSALMAALIARCEAGPWRQMIAIITTLPEAPASPSILLHTRLGFRIVGTLSEVGFKQGRWVDTTVMQRPLAPSP